MIDSGFYNLFFKQTLIEKFSPVIVGLYTAAIFFKTSHLTYNWFVFIHAFKRTLTKPSIDLRLFTFKKAGELGISRKVSIWLSNAVFTPVTFGFLKPVILMPVALLNHLSIQDTESLIIHELTHIQNNDYLLNWLLVITETLFFYNPSIRILAGKIKLEREKNCDVQVLQFKYPAISYAETLLTTAKFKTTINLFTIAAVCKNKQLLQRILFFTKDHNLQFSKKRNGSIIAPFIITAIFLNLLILAEVKNKPSGTRHRETIVLPRPEIKLYRDAVPVAFANIFPDPVAIKAPEATAKIAKGLAKISQRNKEIGERATIAATQSLQIALDNMPENYVIQAASGETEEKDIIVKEEASGTGESITKAYTMRLKNGQWKDELLYVLKEGKPLRDSTICCLKDSVVKIAPAMQ